MFMGETSQWRTSRSVLAHNAPRSSATLASLGNKGVPAVLAILRLTETDSKIFCVINFLRFAKRNF
jgi:hypothetical protein